MRVTAASVNGFDIAVAAGWMAGSSSTGIRLSSGASSRESSTRSATASRASRKATGCSASCPSRSCAKAPSPNTRRPSSTAGSSGPRELTDAEAASLAHTGSTALACLATIGEPAGKTVLIVGATGGVGTLLTQLASAAGAEVIATGRTAEGRELMTELGAAHAVDYAELAASVREVAPTVSTWRCT